MAREVRTFAVTTPAGVTADDPQVTHLVMPPRVVTRIRVRVPPGPRGVLGVALANAGTAVIPTGTGSGWLVTDDETLAFPLAEYITSGTWDLLSYNSGAFPHTVYLIFTCTLPPGPVVAVRPPTVTSISTPGGRTAVTIPGVPPAVTPTLPAPPTPSTPTALPVTPTLSPVTVPGLPPATNAPVAPTTLPATSTRPIAVAGGPTRPQLPAPPPL